MERIVALSVNHTMEDKYFNDAMLLAQEALENQEVPVGCVFVFSNEVVARSRNTVNETHNATRHAEFNCIDQVIDYCKKSQLNHLDVFRNIDVYVTVEPCIMCAAALYELKVKTITYGCKNDRFGGNTVYNVSNIIDTECVVKGGVRSDEAMHLLKEFYMGTNPNAPEPKVKGKKGRKPAEEL